MAAGAARNSAWVRFFCSKDSRVRVATFRKSGREWQLVAVAGQPPAGESAPGRISVGGTFTVSPEYKGCPGCGSAGCGHGGPVGGTIENINALDAG